MTPSTTNRHKFTPFKLSDQVKLILHEKGFSFLFNWSDYLYFKEQTKTAFNKAYTIAELFINENNEAKNDFSDYIF